MVNNLLIRPFLLVSRSTENREVFAFPDGSELHYYFLSGSMVAFCRHRQDLHAQGCRESATTQPKRRGTGRPIGMLVAWLQACDQYEDKSSHVHSCMPSLDARKSAREFFNGLPGSASFSLYETRKEAGDPDEPVTALNSHESTKFAQTI